MSDESLESAVKGVAQGIAGKLKEIAGELIEDDNLEEEGITQQIEGRMRRSDDETAGEPATTADDPDGGKAAETESGA